MTTRPKISPAVTAAAFYVLSLVLILLKTMMVTHHLGYELSFLMILNTLSLLALFTSWYFLFGRTSAIVCLCVVDFILSTLLIGDTLFYRYFGRITLYACHDHIPELWAVSSSVRALFAIVYLLYFLDMVLILFIGIRILKKEIFKKLSIKLRAGVFACIVLVSSGWLTLQYDAFVKPSTKLQLELDRVTRFGIFSFHLFDILRYYKVPAEVELSQEKLKELEALKNGKLAEFRNNHDAYWEAAKNRNVIIILLESVQNFAIHLKIDGQEVTPTLNRLAREGFYFDNFYSQIGPGTTSDSEFLVQFSLYPLAEEHIFSTYYNVPLKGLPDMLKKLGYHNYIFHGNTETFWSRDIMYSRHSIEKFFDEDDFIQDDIIDLGIADESFFRQLVGMWKTKLKKPYYSLIITLTSHHPYTIHEKDRVLSIPKNFATPKFINYLHALHYLDRSLNLFLQGLEEKGLLEDTLIVLFGDHMTPHGYYGEELTAIANLTPNPIEHFKMPCIIYVPPDSSGEKIKGKTISIPSGQIDVMPTLLYLMGLEPEGIFLGKNLITAESNTISLSRFFLPEGSFVSDRHIFINGYKSNRQCLKVPGYQPVDEKNCSKGLKEVKKLLQISDVIIKSGIQLSN